MIVRHLDSNDPHNVGGILSIRVLGIFIRQDCHRICAVNLEDWISQECLIIFSYWYIQYIFITACVHLGPGKILSTHQRPLKVSHFGTSLLQKSLELELGLIRMQEHGLHLLVVPILVVEIAEKTRDSFKSNVPRYLKFNLTVKIFSQALSAKFNFPTELLQTFSKNLLQWNSSLSRSYMHHQISSCSQLKGKH